MPLVAAACCLAAAGSQATNLGRGRAPGNSRIRTLNLSGNNIGDKGAALLAEMLKARTLGCAGRSMWQVVSTALFV